MTGLIPREFIDDLLDRADIVQIIRERVEIKLVGREYKGLCPFHREKTPSFTVSPQKGFFYCFGCHAHGSALSFLMQHDRLGFPAAIEALAARYGLEVPRSGVARPSRKGLYEILNDAKRHYAENLKRDSQAKDYLKGRGLTGEVALAFGLGYAPKGNSVVARFGQTEESQQQLISAGLALKGAAGEMADYFCERIMFPIRDRLGRVTGFGGRAIRDDQPVYRNTPETPVFRKGRGLYGLYELGRRKVSRCVVVGGYMDVIGLSQHDVAGAVAPVGTMVTPQQLARLYEISPSVVFCFDRSVTGQRAAERSAKQLLPEMRDGRQVGFTFLPEDKDPDRYVRAEGKAAFVREIEAATPLSRFVLEQLSQQYDSAAPNDQVSGAKRVRALIGSVPAGVYRELLMAEAGEVASKAENRSQPREEPTGDSPVAAYGTSTFSNAGGSP